MPLTVRELVSIPHLRTWPHAGAGGLDREVSWAHVCELPDPTQWLGAGELVLTTGLGIPADAGEQRAYVERLADAGLSGVAIGDRMYAPPLTDEMIAAAEERALPLLLTSYEVPFTELVRAAAEANRSEEHARVLETLRLYELVREAAVMSSGDGFLRTLGRIAGCELHLLDHRRGVPLVRGATAPSPEIAEQLRAASEARTEPMPAVLRLRPDVLALAVPSARAATLVALPRAGVEPDLMLLRHVAGVAAQEVSREQADAERRRRLGGELLAGLIDGRLAEETAGLALAERGLAAEPRRLAVCLGADEAQSDLHVRLEDRGIAHLLLNRAPLLLALLADHHVAIDGFAAELGPGAVIGLSDPLGRLARVPDAQREARWAANAARASGKRVARYGDDAPSLFLPRSLSEAEQAVGRVLGRLIEYDATHEADLVRSLRVFLECNRSWKEAATRLQIHKQTLVYRMRRVEELTGRRLDDTGDVAELWLALKAAEG